MARRVRCKGGCGELMEREELSELPGTGLVCSSCMLLAADSVATEQGQLEPLSEKDTELDDALLAAAPGTFAPQYQERQDDPELERLRIEEGMADAHLRMVAAGEHPSAELDRPALPPKPNRWRDLPDIQVPGWPLKYGRVSASALATFGRCPEQFRLQNILAISRPQSGAALTGSAVHGALEVQWARRIHQGVDASPREVRDAYHEAFEAMVDKAGGEESVDWKARRGDRDNPAKWRGAGQAVAETIRSEIAPGIEPVAFEDLFVLDLPGVPVPFVGYLDLVSTDRIWDVKVGGRAHSKPATDWRLQGLVYPLSPYRLPMGWISAAWPGKDGGVNTSLVTAGLSASTYKVGVELVRSYVRGILAYTAAFGIDRPWPGMVNHSWACDACEYREQGVCEWWHPQIDIL